MRKRYQKGSLSKLNGVWIAQWWEDGRRRKRTLGKVSQMAKAQAQTELAAILAPINSRRIVASPAFRFGDFVMQVYLPFYKRKWKISTAITNEDRLRYHLTSVYAERSLGGFTRDELQDFLDGKARAGLSYSVVAHLRWDLRQIYGMAVAEGFISRNPAELLFVPREAKRSVARSMTIEEVRTLFFVLDLRERVIAGLAVIAGMRPGEIFGLVRGRLEPEYADVQQRVYRGEVDSPKTIHSRRWAALSDGLAKWIEQWLEFIPDKRPEAWVFPSERLTTPLARDNCWRRSFLPRLKPVGLQWADFQVMRRTHSCLSDHLGIDPQVRADQMGHSVDVNQNVYTKASLRRRKEAVQALETALGVM